MASFWHKATRRVHLRSIVRAEETLRSLSHTGRALFIFFAGVMVLSALGLIYLMNSALQIPSPAYGGSLQEGIVGTPRFINPVLAVSDADRDMTSLIYSGLLRATPKGDYVPDLAASYTISPDGRVYTFVIRTDATFQNGTPVVADDVLYTVQKTQNPQLKSPRRANWDGVEVQALDSHTISFTLRSAYAPFIENLTLGILPKSLWQDVSDDEFPFSELNSMPVGSGPFKVTGVERTASGIPSAYTLAPNRNYSLGMPYLSKLTLRFYQGEDKLMQALQQGDVESASGISPGLLGTTTNTVQTAPLNRVFAVFFNQNQSTLLRDKDVRQALNDSIDRSDLIHEVLGGYGSALMGPIPGLQGVASSSLAAAQQRLLSKGWVLNAGVLQKTTGKGAKAQTVVLEFSLATADVPELRAAAQYLKEKWGALGAKVDVQVYEQGDLSQNVIRPRKYDALLFGEVVGRELDLFAFWHSSQRNDPGLNISLYANSTADKALERLRTTQTESERQTLLHEFDLEVQKDIPAVFLYAPDFVYTVPQDLQGVELGVIETPSDRFLSVASWHREVDWVWPIFAPASH